DAFGNIATGYTGIVHFTSTDSQATAGAGLPANYTFVRSDDRRVGKECGLTRKPAGTRNVTATDTVTSSIYGPTNTLTVTQAGVNVLSAVDHIGTANATGAQAGTLPAKDAFGNIATGYTGIVHFTSTDSQATAGAGLPANYTFV